METPEVRQARALENSSLSKRRAAEKRPPDFKPLNMADLDKEIPGLADAMMAEGPESKTCEECGNTLDRLYLPDPFKRLMPGHAFRPWTTCQCVIDATERERVREERLERKRRLQRTYAKSMMAPALVNARLDNFTLRPGTEKAYEKAQEFYFTFETRATGLLFFGVVGNGKSHLARGIEWQLDQDGWATLFLDWPQMVELAKATFDNNNKMTVNDYIRAAIDADVLVLDEIGAGFLTDWEFKNLLFPILNGRAGKKTIFTTNLDLDRLTAWFAADKNGLPLDEDGRLIDRIIGGCEIVRNKGTSKRREDAMRRLEE